MNTLLFNTWNSLSNFWQAGKLINPMNEKDSRFTGDAGEELTPRPGLRASNTTKTLAPRDIYETPNGGTVTLEQLRAPEEALKNALADNRLAGLPDPFKTYDPVQKADIDYSPKYDGPQTKGIDIGSSKPEKYNCLPVDWPTAQETMGLPKSPEPKKIYSVAELAGRIERLEEQLDGLLDRLAKYNIRAQHRI